MALTGTYSRTLDEKKRVAVPKRLRDEFGESELSNLYIAPGTERSLSLYAPTAFDALARKLAESSSNRADQRNYLRLFYSRAEKVDLDGQGRIRIPERLAVFAQLDREITLLGVHDHAEIWASEIWAQFLEQHASEFDKMAESAFE